MFDWELPDVEMPVGDDTPNLTPEQWVVWFRTLPTTSQVATAAEIIETSTKFYGLKMLNVEDRLEHSELTVEELRARIVDIQGALRSILRDTKDMRPQKKRAALLAERVTAIGLAIKGMRL